MDKKLTLTLAQLNWLVGDLEGNTNRMLAIAAQQQHSSDLVMFSELALSGYPPEDLVYRDDFHQRCQQQLERLQAASQHVGIIVGHPHKQDGLCYNALSFFHQGKLLARYYKQLLPNYGVFDEMRYFSAGDTTCVVDFKGYKLGLLICEDLWFNPPVDAVKAAGADILLSINASPYNQEKPHIRHQLLSEHCQRTAMPLIYLNQVGGQDELVFDGSSKVFDMYGEQTHQLVAFEENIEQVDFEGSQILPMETPAVDLPPLAQVYQALVLAVRDYVQKNGFRGALLGLSGGIDSALTLAIAVDALGKENVQAVMMPFRYTADISIADAKEEADYLGVEFDIVSIEPMFDAFMAQMSPLFVGTERDTTEENLQARCRGVILMALSNKRRRLVLTTGNKSEVAVGYSTLYGDMVGGFAPIKDIPKTLVFQLAEYRNSISYVIPQRVIDRPPSAELAPDQKDEDSLPPYPILDAILAGYVEQDLSVTQLVEQGFDEAVVRKVIRLVDINEYKRRQAAVGPKMTSRSFGKERRYPLTSGFGRKNW